MNNFLRTLRQLDLRIGRCLPSHVHYARLDLAGTPSYGLLPDTLPARTTALGSNSFRVPPRL